jgi:N,N-dimethylformamidase
VTDPTGIRSARASAPSRPADPETLTGYTPRLEYAPGDTVDLHVSAEGPGTARLVRLPDGASVDEQAARFTASRHPLPLGSFGTATVPVPAGSTLTAELQVHPTHPHPADAVILALSRPGSPVTVSVGLDGDGLLAVGVSDTASALTTTTPLGMGALTRHSWHRLSVVVEHAGDDTSVRVEVSSRDLPHTRSAVVRLLPAASLFDGSAAPDEPIPAGAGRLRVGLAALVGEDERGTRHFDGKLDAVIVGGQHLDLDPDQLDSAIVHRESGKTCGRLVNGPTRAVTGHLWRDQVQRWPEAPELYSAAHFHRDDLEDAGWPVAGRLGLPEDLPNGLYAVRLTRDDDPGHHDLLPLVVRSAHSAPAAITVLLPTFTYLAYADEAPFAPHEPVVEHPGDRYAARHGLTSLYSFHADGSGVATASLRRPLLNLRPDYVYWLTGHPHGLGADLEILRLLEHLGLDYDVITDHGLDADPTLLDGRRTLVTGSHPEYWSRRGMEALEAWQSGGDGRLLYLGGNGFHAMVAVVPGAPHVLELRRRGAEVGLWEAAPGEAAHAVTGELGGLWRHHSPTPSRLTGLTYCTMGFANGVGYRMLPASGDPRAAFLVEGLDEAVLDGSAPLGERGLWFGAAVAYECDRADRDRGTPQHALVIAGSDPLPGAYEATDSSGEREAHLVLFETPAGGAVFSVGSIAFAGALPVDGYANPTATMIGNVLRRFAAPERFSFPPAEDRTVRTPPVARPGVG